MAIATACATDLLEGGYDIRTVQELLGHVELQATMIHTHVLNKGGIGVRSALDLARECRIARNRTRGVVFRVAAPPENPR